MHSCIQVKTFYSTIPLVGMPSDHLCRASRHLHVRSEPIILVSRKASLCTYDLTDEPLQQDKGYDCHSAPLKAILLPIDVAQNLLPTFCSLLAARRYVLRVNLRIKGIHHPPLVLDAPLQVCHSSSSAVHLDHGSLEHGDQIYAPASPKPFHASTCDEDGLRAVSPYPIPHSHTTYGTLID